MAFNGSGVFNRIHNWVTDKNNSIPITASRMDTEDDGFATGLSNCITKDGQTTITQNIPFNGKKITGLGDPTAAQDGATKAYVDGLTGSGVKAITNADSPYTLLAADEGKLITIDASGGSVTVNLLAAATAGDGFSVGFKRVNGTANTITIDGDGSETIDGSTTITIDGDDEVAALECDGTNWERRGAFAVGAVNDLAGIAFVQGDILYHDGTNLVKLALGAAGQAFKVNSGATAPEWGTVSGVPNLIAEHQEASGTNGGTATLGSWLSRPINTEVKNALTGAGVVFEIAYDAQTANFTVGDTLTGGTSSATATIVADSDGGATGTLKVINISGTFQDNETITDPSGGSATSNIPSGVVAADQIYLPAGTYYAEFSGFFYRTTGSYLRLYDVTNATDRGQSLLIRVSGGDFTGALAEGDAPDFTIGSGALFELQYQTTRTQATDGLGFANAFSTERYAKVKIWQL